MKTTLKYINKLKASPSQRYHVLVKSFTLKQDPNQEIVVKKLDELYEKLQHYEAPKLPNEPDTQSIASLGTFDIASSSSNNTPTSSGFFGRIFGGNSDKNEAQPSSSPPSPSSPTNAAKPITLNNVTVPNGLYVHGSTGMIINVCLLSLHSMIYRNWKDNVNGFIL